ncbi:hypothetical protein D5086_014282 [Populus alba]|uniref:Uncharacterized protein n=1 Tax=Populus alba TaxID=43335 RepID=A0ACC4BYX2_POPAL
MGAGEGQRPLLKPSSLPKFANSTYSFFFFSKVPPLLSPTRQWLTHFGFFLLPMAPFVVREVYTIRASWPFLGRVVLKPRARHSPGGGWTPPELLANPGAFCGRAGLQRHKLKNRLGGPYLARTKYPGRTPALRVGPGARGLELKTSSGFRRNLLLSFNFFISSYLIETTAIDQNGAAYMTLSLNSLNKECTQNAIRRKE